MRLVKYENHYINPDCVVCIESKGAYRQQVTLTTGNVLTVQASEKALTDALSDSTKPLSVITPETVKPTREDPNEYTPF